MNAAAVMLRKTELGQFMTPPAVAHFMAGMFPRGRYREVRLLDAGAGRGSLTAAFLERAARGDIGSAKLSVTAYELDEHLLPYLTETLSRFADAKASIVPADFIESGVLDYKRERVRPYTHAILNPPYKKIANASRHRALLRMAGIETVNLYSGFVALALLLMQKGGFVCAIIPRSFCNGPYFRPFRDFLFDRAALRRIHLFDARDKAFSGDDVLQENVIILLEKGGLQGAVDISRSRDASFSDLQSYLVPFDRVVRPDDPERVIHIPVSPEDVSAIPPAFDRNLSDLGLEVSTGPVVDFRLKEDLRSDPDRNTVPLLYPLHFGPEGLAWPRKGAKKPNAIVRNDRTERWLYPAGNYAVTRRFSSKEERRRVVANLVPKNAFLHEVVGFENHLNVFHKRRSGLSMHLALGLVVYLNSTMVDAHFRTFNGHTQVNASDLRMLPYPDEESLLRMGRWAEGQGPLSQEAIDAFLEGAP